MDATLDTATIIFPSKHINLVKELVKKFGWKFTQDKKTGIEEALEDIKKKKVYGPYSSTKDMFKSMDIDV